MLGHDITMIQSIPDDALIESLSYLPLEDLLNARAVSRCFEKAALIDLKERELRLVDISIGWKHSIALFVNKRGGQQLFAWGRNDCGQLGLGDNDDRNTPQALDMSFLAGAEITQLAAGSSHTLIQAQTAAGDTQLFAWGDNEYGQLGLGDEVVRNTPQALDMGFLAGAEITQLAAGSAHALVQARTAAGETQLFAWGDNAWGQLGLGDEVNRNTPQALDRGVLAGAKITQLAVGCSHALIQARTAAGDAQLFAWGNNMFSQLGLGDEVDRNTPQALDMGFLAGAEITQLAAGSSHTFIQARTAAGETQLFAWGGNDRGQLGLGGEVRISTPQALDRGFLAGAEITQLTAGSLHTLIQARTAAGETQLFVCGDNDCGQLGLGDNVSRNIPQALDRGFLAGAEITQLAAGSSHTFIQARTAAGETQLFAWGYNEFGQLGLDDNTDINTPQQLCLGPFKPVHHQLSVGQTERRLARIDTKNPSQTTALSNALCLGFGAAVGVSLFQSRESQLTGSLIAAGLLSKAQSKAHKRRREKAAIAYHDESVKKKQSRHYQLGLKSATSNASYVLSYFKICGKNANKEWHAGYAAGLLEEETRKQQQKLKQQ